MSLGDSFFAVFVAVAVNPVVAVVVVVIKYHVSIVYYQLFQFDIRGSIHLGNKSFY